MSIEPNRKNRESQGYPIFMKSSMPAKTPMPTLTGSKFGARIYKLPRGRIWVFQTVQRGTATPPRYVIDSAKRKSPAHRRNVPLRNDLEIANAVRAALDGTLCAVGVDPLK
jgi:hypothetical protein